MPSKCDKPHKSGFARALNEIIHIDGVVTAREIARETGYTRQHIASIANPFSEAEPSMKCAEDISRMLHREFGETRQMQGMRHEPKAEFQDLDGSLLNELSQINQHIVHAEDELEKTNVGEAKRLASKARGQVDKCIAEIENCANGQAAQ